jgi:hypothetical protein
MVHPRTEDGSMTPLDAAQAMTEQGTLYDHHEEPYRLCLYCEGAYDDHDKDCPGLLLPRIVAALEAAQALIRFYKDHPAPDTQDTKARIRLYMRLEALLDLEVPA